MSHPFFKGRRLCIATKHGKERVIASLLEEALGVSTFVPDDFDTDELGTFTGEVLRTDTPIEAARKKCNQAMDQTGCDLAVASEGSFGSHPTLLFVPADEEFLVLVDRANKLEVVARTISTETNFDGIEVTSESELLEFARKIQFPEHAIILKDTQKNWNYIQKGINNETQLLSAYKECMSTHESVFVETDMRAMNNPLRMAAIGKTVEVLKEKIFSACPSCGFPGFDVVEREAGLPCSQCSLPTRSTLNLIYRCSNCNFEQKKAFPSGKTQEDPMYCDFCNP